MSSFYVLLIFSLLLGYSLSFPVEMMISLPDGTVVHHVNANDLLDSQEGGADESFMGYVCIYMVVLGVTANMMRRYLI